MTTSGRGDGNATCVVGVAVIRTVDVVGTDAAVVVVATVGGEVTLGGVFSVTVDEVDGGRTGSTRGALVVALEDPAEVSVAGIVP